MADLFGKAVEQPLKLLQRVAGEGARIGQAGQDAVARRRSERRVDAAGDDPRWVYPLLRQGFDGVLPEFAQRHPGARRLRVGIDQSEYVAEGRIGIEAQQQVGSRQIEEAEGVRLRHLGAMDEFPQPDAGFGRRHRHDRVASFGGSQQVADRADAANARGDRRHLVERAALDEFFESADLGDVQLRIGDDSLVIEVDVDFGVSLDAGDGINGDFPHGRSRLSKFHFRTQIRHAPFEELVEHKGDGFGRGRAAGYMEVDFDALVNRHGVAQ